MKELKLGVIGMSPGNGHPYSWSAIFNGYEELNMRECPYPVIYGYLSRQSFPHDSIPNAKVTHIWTQDQRISRQVALASKIENVVAEMTDMIGEVDAVLLARDDAEAHFEMAQPFLKAELPVFIDKPLAYSVDEAKKILELEQYPGQVFTSSGLRFAKELHLNSDQKAKIGKIQHVIGSVPKDWKKYSIHIIDPILNNFEDLGQISTHQRWCVEGNTTLAILWSSGVQGTFFNFENGVTPIQLQFIGDKGSETLVFQDTFQAFKASLESFVLSVREKRRVIPLEQTFAAIEIVEKGIG